MHRENQWMQKGFGEGTREILEPMKWYHKTTTTIIIIVNGEKEVDLKIYCTFLYCMRNCHLSILLIILKGKSYFSRMHWSVRTFIEIILYLYVFIVSFRMIVLWHITSIICSNEHYLCCIRLNIWMFCMTNQISRYSKVSGVMFSY